MKKALLSILFTALLFPTFCPAQSTFNYNEWKTKHEATQKENKHEPDFNDNVLKQTCIYADGFVQVGTMRGPGASIGGYVHNINIEASYIHGLVESYQIERIFGDAHHSFTYKPVYFGGKVGYGFDFLGCLRLTPQVGIGILRVNGRQANEDTTRNKEHANATIVSGGVKLSFAFHKNFGVYVGPEYQIKIANGEIFDRITDNTGVHVSPNSSTKEITNWTNGFRVRVGLEVIL